MAPLAGKAGETIMLAPYPKCDSSRIDPQAEQEMEQVKEVVNAARNLRSTMNLPPATRVPMYIADAAPALHHHEAGIAALARLSEVRFVAQLPAEDAPVAILACAKLMLHVEMDKGAERMRASRRKWIGSRARWRKAKAKLGNASFVERAPPAVVDLERKRLADFEAKHADLRSPAGKARLLTDYPTCPTPTPSRPSSRRTSGTTTSARPSRCWGRGSSRWR